MAISAQWQTVATVSSTVNTFYTVPSSGNYGSYARDMVVTNSGANTLFVTFNPSSTTCTSAASFQIPAGGSVVLTQCQVPAGSVVGVACGGTLSTAVSIGYGTNVSYV